MRDLIGYYGSIQKKARERQHLKIRLCRSLVSKPFGKEIAHFAKSKWLIDKIVHTRLQALLLDVLRTIGGNGNNDHVLARICFMLADELCSSKPIHDRHL